MCLCLFCLFFNVGSGGIRVGLFRSVGWPSIILLVFLKTFQAPLCLKRFFLCEPDFLLQLRRVTLLLSNQQRRPDNRFGVFTPQSAFFY